MVSLLTTLLLSVPFALAQQPRLDPRHIDASHVGPPIDIGSTWLAHEGDDPGYAAPHLDDSRWVVISSSDTIRTYLPVVDKLWYRTHVHVPEGSHDLGLLLRVFMGSYQIFVNGRQIGPAASSTEGGRYGSHIYDDVLTIPDALIGDGDLTIAVRAYTRKADVDFVGFRSAVLLGPAQELKDRYQIRLFRRFTPTFLIIELEALLLLTAISLLLMMRSSREDRALAVFVAAALLLDFSTALFIFDDLFNSDLSLVAGVLEIITNLALLEFVRFVAGFRRSRALTLYEWTYATVALPIEVFRTLLNSGHLSPFRDSQFVRYVFMSESIITLPVHFGLPLIAALAWHRRRNRDALLLLVPLIVAAFYHVALFVPYARMIVTHASGYAPLGRVPIPFFLVDWGDVDNFLFLVTLLVFVVLRAIRIARSRSALAAELKAAHNVQQLLLTHAAQPTPGFLIESVYLPAAEVGGDFYFVSPAPDGSITALIGDVSGKGLQAAMRVAMILGVLRREDSREPASILGSLNQALHSQGGVGFTTACCVRLQPDGSFSIANAGHISPYVEGAEWETAYGLPLGLTAETEYEERSGQLGGHGRMVLMSDGVVEARNKTGELYGFDRLAPLTLQPAQEIAATAKAFGQEDDITVVSIACEPVASRSLS